MRSLLEKSLAKYVLPLLALAGLAFIWSCNTTSEDGDQWITWSLNPSVADYDTVDIKLVDTKDPAIVYDKVWHAPIGDPAKFPRFKVLLAKGKDFTIQIRCYNKASDLLLSKDIPVEGAKPGAPIVLTADVRLFALSISPGSLDAGFAPNKSTFTAKVDENVSSLSLIAIPLDTGNVLTVEGKVRKWGAAFSVDLKIGANPIVLKVSTKDGNISKSYELQVTRGRVVKADEVTAISLDKESFTLYTGDDPAALKAETTPPGAAVTWTSLNENAATVDATGKVTAVGPGTAKIIARAGDFADTAEATVKKDPPILEVGGNISVKPGTEVTFNVTITQEHGTIVSFKYDLNDDGKTDNADSNSAPNSPLTLKQTYDKEGTYIARFEAKDKEGNVTPATRTIVVSNSKLQLVILKPGRDTLVNTPNLLVVYEVNGNKFERTVALQEGKHPITIDTVNGSEKGSQTINVELDTQKPGAPAVTGPAATTDLKPTWTWNAGNPAGNAGFRAALDDSTGLNVAVTGPAKSYTPVNNLLPGEHTLWAQERDSAGNWSDAGKFKLTITAKDVTPPGTPKITAPTNTDKAPKWAWISGGGGAGIFKFKLGDSTFSGVTESGTNEFTLADAPVNGKAYTLFVAERDSALNWSKISSATITFDAGKPIVAIAGPAPNGTYYTIKSVLPFSGTVTGPNTIVKVSFKINLVYAADAEYSEGNWSIAAVPVAEGSATIVTIVATDNLGITGEATLTVLRDNTNPNPPVITTSPASPGKAATGGFAWTKGSDNTNGSGLNGKYRWSWDSATWTETTELLVNTLALKEGSSTFYLEEQDEAGNWSASAKKAIVADFKGPNLAITNPINASTQGTIHVTATGSVSDSLTSVASVLVTGQESGSGTATVTGGTWTTADLVLRNSGLDTLTVTATDAVGNPTVKTVVVTINVALPQIDISYPTEAMPYNKDTITVQYKVNSGTLQKQLFTKAPADPDGNWALEIVSTANEAGQINKKTVTILRDKTGPGAPTVTPAGVTWTKVLPSWSFVTGGDAGSGPNPAVWECSYQYNGGTATTSTSATSACALPSGLEGNYTFTVRQQDKAGNWGPLSAISTLKYDKTAPVMSVVSPATGLVTNVDSIIVSCRVGTTNLAGKKRDLIDGANTLYCDSTDSAGNLGRATVTVYGAQNTIFVDAKAPYPGDGTSWGKAFTYVQDAMAAWTAGKDIWVAAGKYYAPSNDTGFFTKSGMKFYGGFPSNGSAYTTAMRTFAAADTSILESGKKHIFSMWGASNSAKVTNVLVDGFKVHYSNATYGGSGFYMLNATGITVQKCVVAHNMGTGSVLYASNAGYSFDQCKFFGHGFEGSAIMSDASTSTFSNCEFSGNNWPTDYKILIRFDTPGSATFTKTVFLDDLKDPTAGAGNHYIEFSNKAGTLNITSCTFAAKEDPAISVPAGTPGNRTGNTFP